MSGSPGIVTTDSDGAPPYEQMVSRILGSSSPSATSPVLETTIGRELNLDSMLNYSASVNPGAQKEGVSDRIKLARSSQAQYVSLLEGENLELAEKALELERQLAESDRQSERLSMKNQEMSHRLNDEVSRRENHAQELTSSMLQIKHRTEQSAKAEIKTLRRELEKALVKKADLESAFHVQNRTIAELSGENLEYEEKMKAVNAVSEDKAGDLRANLDQAMQRIRELSDMLAEKTEETARLRRDMEVVQCDAREASTSLLSESKRYNTNEMALNDSLQELRREMSVLAERERALRSDAVKKEGALGAMSHDRLQAVQDLMLKEGECDKFSAQVQQYKADLDEAKRLRQSSQLEWKEKTKRWIETNQKAQETIESLKELSEQEGKRANRLEIETATLKSDLQYERKEIKRLKEEDSIAMKNLVAARQKMSRVSQERSAEKRLSEKIELERGVLLKKVERFDRQVSDLHLSREQILGVVKFQSDALQRLSQDYEALSNSVRNVGGEIRNGRELKMRVETDSSQLHETGKQLEEMLHQREVDLTNMKKQYAETERENIRLREENVEMKFAKERLVTLEADKRLVEDLKTKLSVSDTKAAELENSLRAMQVEYNHLKSLVKPQTETMEQMAIELKRALEREQAVRNELVSCESRLAQLNSVRFVNSQLGQTPNIPPSFHWSSRSYR